MIYSNLIDIQTKRNSLKILKNLTSILLLQIQDLDDVDLTCQILSVEFYLPQQVGKIAWDNHLEDHVDLTERNQFDIMLILLTDFLSHDPNQNIYDDMREKKYMIKCDGR